MVWRKWLVRGLVLAVTAALGLAGYAYQRFTDPAAVRQQVIAQLGVHFTGAEVGLDSAQLKLLGGISLSELRLTRRDDHSDLLYVPSATVFLDKEQIKDGKLAVRRIDLNHARIRVWRRADGRWNLANVLGPVRPDEPIPQISIRDGTLVFEDSQAAAPPVEIADVSLTFINDPRPVMNFQGAGRCEFGPVRIAGTWNRVTDETTLAIEAPELPIGPPVVDRLAAYAPDVRVHAAGLRGTASVRADFTHTPGTPQPWTHTVECRLTDGRLRHPQLPLTLEGLEAAARCVDGRVTLEKLTAHAGATAVTATASAAGLRPDADFALRVDVSHLGLGPDVFARLPDNLRRVNDEFQPRGTLSLSLICARERGHWKRSCAVRAEDLATTFFRFPYTLRHVTGTLEQDIDTRQHRDVLRADLVGLADKQRVFVKGTMTGEGPASEVSFQVWGDDLVLDERLEKALPPVYQRLAHSFHPTGLANFHAWIDRKQGAHEFSNRFLIHFHHAAARYDVFPYPLEDVSGTLDILPDHWEFAGFRGSHNGCEVRTSGRNFPAAGNDRIAVEVTGDRVLLDDELERALAPDLKQAWKVFSPTGRMRFDAHVECLANQPPDVDVTITALGCAVRPTFFPYTLDHLTGSVRYARHWVYLENLAARHGTSVLTLDKGRVYVKPGGGVWADVDTVRGSPVVPDRDLIQALPPLLRGACETLQLHDPVELQTRLTIATSAAADGNPAIYWEGGATLRHATLHTGVQLDNVTGTVACRGLFQDQRLHGLVGNIDVDELAVFRQPFRSLKGSFQVPGQEPGGGPERPLALEFPGLQARVFSGEVYGPLRIQFGPTLHYELNLTASQVRLDEFARHNLERNSQVSGQAYGRLHLEGDGADLAGLRGNGSVDVPNGRLYTLPLLLDLLKFLGLRLPDGTAFEEAHTAFGISGQRVAISRLDLFGNAVSLRGKGEMNLDGTGINLELYALWAKFVQVLPPVIKEIPPKISQYLLKIKVRGRLGQVRFEKEPVPVLVDPVKELLERMRR